MAIVQAPNDFQATLDARRTLKIERLGCLRHLGRKLVDDILRWPDKKRSTTLDVLGIVGRGNRANACARPAPDMVVKAGTPVLQRKSIDDVFFALMRFDDAGGSGAIPHRMPSK